MLEPVTFRPIGLVRTPFADRVGTPRQPAAARGVRGTIELFPGNDYEHALEDLVGWDRLWVVFVFHLNKGWRPKVLPPRSDGRRRGVFSTRAPYRPNPIGLSAVRLLGVEGLRVHVEDVDLVDGTPVLDLKPYVPYTDAYPEARSGWLEASPSDALCGETPADPRADYEVVSGPRAEEQLAWLRAEHGLDLFEPVAAILRLGPQPHPYRRIRREGLGYRLAYRDWRVLFQLDGRVVTLMEVGVGYRSAELRSSTEPAVALQRAFAARFPVPDAAPAK